MTLRVLLLLSLLSLAAGQAEHSILAQFIYPPVALAKAVTKEHDHMEPAPSEAHTEEMLQVLPLLARFRRSGFNQEKYSGGNDVILTRFKTKMSDPGWVPEIFPRFGGEKSSASEEHI